MSLPELEFTEDGTHYLYEGKPLERVTAIVSDALPPYLAPWAEGVGQTAMHKIMAENPEYDLATAKRAIANAGLTCENEKIKGQDRGQALHQAIEAMILSEDLAVDPTDFEDPEHAKYARSFAAFMADYRPKFEMAEVRVCYPELGYAGTFDAVAKVTARPKGARGPDVTGKRIILDWKTNVSKKTYESHLYQLAAYQLAMERWDDPVEGAAVVAIGPMGDVKGKPYTFKVNHVDPEAFRAMIGWRNVLKNQKANNPLGRSK
jgi:hypothetical protein